MSDWEDTELIECAQCKAPLNGKSLWVVDGEHGEPLTICEECHQQAVKVEPYEDVSKAANDAGNLYVKKSQHVDFTQTEDGEVLIRNIRFMAFCAGFKEGAKWKK